MKFKVKKKFMDAYYNHGDRYCKHHSYNNISNTFIISGMVAAQSRVVSVNTSEANKAFLLYFIENMIAVVADGDAAIITAMVLSVSLIGSLMTNAIIASGRIISFIKAI